MQDMIVILIPRYLHYLLSGFSRSLFQIEWIQKYHSVCFWKLSHGNWSNKWLHIVVVKKSFKWVTLGCTHFCVTTLITFICFIFRNPYKAAIDLRISQQEICLHMNCNKYTGIFNCTFLKQVQLIINGL